MIIKHALAAVAAAVGLGLAPSALASGFDAAVAQTPGLIAYYPFNGQTATNSTVGGYTVTLMNGASIEPPGSGPSAGDPNSFAVMLSNSGSCNQYVPAFAPKPLIGQIVDRGSVVAWIKLASLPTKEGRIFSVAGESTVADDFDLQIDNSDNSLRLYTDSGGYAAAPPFTDADAGKWVFVAGTFAAGGQRTVYVNGVKAGASAAGPHHASPTADFYIGQSNVFNGRCFNGEVANVAIFKTTLTAAQIVGLYHAASAD